MAKSSEFFSLQLKRPKLSEGKTMITSHNFFRYSESIDLVLKLIQKISPKMEQKLVQRYETEIVANACNAS